MKPDALPRIDVGETDKDDVLDVLRELQFAMLRHPVASQSLFSALIAEGRRYSSTQEGKEWTRRLAGSELVRKGRIVWEVATMSMLEESPQGVLPSTYLEAIARAASTKDLEPLLAELFEMGKSEEVPGAS